MNEDKATRYHRLRRRASLSATALSAMFLLVLIVTGRSVSLRETAASAAHGSLFLTVIFYVVLLALLSEALSCHWRFIRASLWSGATGCPRKPQRTGGSIG